MFEGKRKALTFSYDDGTTQDIRLIEIFNKYGLKATFNLNSELLGEVNSFDINGKEINHTKNKPEDIRRIYKGHEVAVHTLTHPKLTEIESNDEVLRQVEEDRRNLSELVGYEVKGMAYPCGGVNCNDRVADIIRTNTPIKYARTTAVTHSFIPDTELFQFKGTVYHHRDWDVLFDLGRKFIESESDEPQLFYIWGHSFEFDIYPDRWDGFEEFCKMMSNRNDIYYASNIEALGKF